MTRRGRRACAVFLLAGGAFATCEAHLVFSVNEPWAKVAPDGRSAEVFMRLTSSENARLVSVTSPAARRVAIRAVASAKGDVAAEVALPAKQVVVLARGQSRIQLAGFAHKPRLGDHIALTLAMRADDGSVHEIPLEAEVRLHSPTEDEGGPPHAHAH